MAKIQIKKWGGRQFGDTPYGNLSALPFAVAFTATGAVVDGSVTTPVAVADKVILGTLPAGFCGIDAIVHVTDGLTATVKGTLGIEYVDGVDSAKVPQTADFYSAALALDAAGKVRATGGAKPAPLPKTAYLVLTISGAANAKAAKLDVRMVGELVGAS